MLPISSADTKKRAHDTAFYQNIYLQTGLSSTSRVLRLYVFNRLHTPREAACALKEIAQESEKLSTMRIKSTSPAF